MKNLFEFLTNAIHESEAAYIAGMSLGECENLAGELQEKIEPKITAITEILEDVAEQLPNVAEYSNNEVQKAIIILKELQ